MQAIRIGRLQDRVHGGLAGGNSPLGQHAADRLHGKPHHVGEAAADPFEESVTVILDTAGAGLAGPSAGI